MLETPQITPMPGQQTAVIHLTIARADIAQVMGPGIQELIATLAAQAVQPAGAWFARYLNMTPATFELEIGIPVAASVTPAGRVTPGQVPAARVARTVFQGHYAGLHAAWTEFGAWIDAQGLKPAPGMLECYTKGPESDPDPASWRTELIQPLAD